MERAGYAALPLAGRGKRATVVFPGATRAAGEVSEADAAMGSAGALEFPDFRFPPGEPIARGTHWKRKSENCSTHWNDYREESTNAKVSALHENGDTKCPRSLSGDWSSAFFLLSRL